MSVRRFKNRERVTVHSLGDDKLYRAIVVGISIENYPRSTIYIVRQVDFVRDENYDYDCFTITEACLRIGWPGTKRYLGGIMLDKLEK